MPGLIHAAQNGDQAAWAELVRRYESLIRRIAQRHRLSAADTEDIVQLTWLRLAEHIWEIRDPARIAGWLACTARNECIQLFRRRRCTVSLDGLDLPADEHAQPEAVVAAADERHRLAAALRTLPPRQEQLMRVLLAPSGPSYADAARILGLEIGSVGPLRQRALARLRREVDKAGRH